MKKSSLVLMIVIISFVLSAFIKRTEISYNASPCIHTDVCVEISLGTKTKVSYGFPATFRQTITFDPLDKSKTGVMDQGSGTNYQLLFVNAIFWSAALLQAVRLIPKVAKRRHK